MDCWSSLHCTVQHSRVFAVLYTALKCTVISMNENLLFDGVINNDMIDIMVSWYLFHGVNNNDMIVIMVSRYLFHGVINNDVI